MGRLRMTMGWVVLGALLVSACAPGGSGGAGPAGAGRSGGAEGAKPSGGGAGAPAAGAGAAGGIAAGAGAVRVGPRNVVVGHFGWSVNSWPLAVADQQGFLAEQGLTLEVIPIGSGPGLVQAMLGGSLETVMMSPESIVNASQRGGADLVTVMGVQTIPLMELHAVGAMRQVPELRGKKVAVSNIKSQDGLFARLLLRHAGVRDDEYDLVVVGGTAQRYAALKAGGVEATMLSSPVTYTSKDDGQVVLGQIADILDHFQFLGYHTRREWGRENRATLVGLLRGVEKGRQLIMDPANKAAVVGILVSATNASEVDGLRTYDEFTRYARYFTPEVDVEGYRVMMQHLHERGDIDRVDDPMNYIDLSYLREAFGR